MRLDYANKRGPVQQPFLPRGVGRLRSGGAAGRARANRPGQPGGRVKTREKAQKLRQKAGKTAKNVPQREEKGQGRRPPREKGGPGGPPRTERRLRRHLPVPAEGPAAVLCRRLRPERAGVLPRLAHLRRLLYPVVRHLHWLYLCGRHRPRAGGRMVEARTRLCADIQADNDTHNRRPGRFFRDGRAVWAGAGYRHRLRRHSARVLLHQRRLQMAARAAV